MKKLLTIFLLLIGFAAEAQLPVQRGTKSVAVMDAYLYSTFGLKVPVYGDTTAANLMVGHDSLGLIIETISPASIYFRAKSTGTFNKWTILATTPASPIWGLITGTLSSQTDLQTALNAKQNLIATGTTGQYFRGDLSLATFPTDLSSFSNGPGYLTAVNVTNSVTGDGSSGTPLKLLNDAASPGANQAYGTDNGGTKGWHSIPIQGATNGLSISGSNVLLGGNPLIQNTTIHGAFHQFTADSLSLYKIATLNVGTGVNVTEQITAGGYFRQLWNGVSGSSQVITNFSSSLSGSDGTMGMTADKGTGGTFVPSIQLNTSDSSTVIEGHIIKFVSDTSWANAAITIDALPYITSTTNMASVGWNNVTKQLFAIPYGAGGGGGVAVDVVQSYTTGTTLTQTTGDNIIQLNPASVQSTLTITTATSANWHNSNDLYIVAGGTVTSGNPVITTLSVVAGPGLTLVQSTTPAMINAGEVIRYHKIGTLIYRIN